MDGATTNASGDRRSIMLWDESDVQTWLASIGFPQYESHIQDHRISGEVLCSLDQEQLKQLGVLSVGQRLTILKNVYLQKLAHNVPISEDSYVPPSEVQTKRESITIERLYDMIKNLEKQMHQMEEDNRYLREVMQIFIEEHQNRSSNHNESPVSRQDSFNWSAYVKPDRSPTTTKSTLVDSPHPSPQRTEYSQTDTRNLVSSTPTAGKPQPHRQESSDNLKSFKVSLDDPTWKVLPAALKKYKINNDTWQNYAMFICFGAPTNRIERCLSYDEKPLLLFQKLKDSKKNPVFMLKHIKDIRSPIAVAQQKHAARKASTSALPPKAGSDSVAASSTAHSLGHTRTGSRPPRIEVNNLLPGSTPSLPTGGATPNPGWSEVFSPSGEKKEELGTQNASGGPAALPDTLPTTGGLTPSLDTAKASEPSTSSHARETPITSNGVSYAIAIYPYMAEQPDEFDVVVGDYFIILSRARGWWVVQRDPVGTGVVDPDTSKQGWVPAGCLLETNVPVASAIAEATTANGSGDSSLPSSPTHRNKTPIMPLSIVSTSFPGIALMDYQKKGEEELDLVKDDALRVFKKYNHWSYAVKEVGGDRGWVPSWFIGKVSTGNPPTPNTTVIVTEPTNSNLASQTNSQAQMSPMSSAFPMTQGIEQ